MKFKLAIFSLLLSLYSCSHKENKDYNSLMNSDNLKIVDTVGYVSFNTQIDINEAQKDGFNLNGYIVVIDYERAKKMDRKRIKVSGLAIIIKGLKNRPKKYNESGNADIEQGRDDDTKYINDPKIELLD